MTRLFGELSMLPSVLIRIEKVELLVAARPTTGAKRRDC